MLHIKHVRCCVSNTVDGACQTNGLVTVHVSAVWHRCGLHGRPRKDLVCLRIVLPLCSCLAGWGGNRRSVWPRQQPRQARRYLLHKRLQTQCSNGHVPVTGLGAWRQRATSLHTQNIITQT